ncbi:MAG: MlaD family protein [Solirubrobacteraceae bacterium]
MRRAFVIGLIAVAAIAGATFALGAGSAKGKTYKVVLDSAFGLVKGADFKVGGVAVGSISDLDVDRKTARALVEVEVSSDSAGFGGLRDSATCTVAPQSLIGEYFVDCQPGKDGELLESGATIPVDRTSSPIPPDLVLNVMRRPIAERFAIIFGELGIGFAARGNDVNETIRRAIPALQTTNDVLALLADKRRTLASLARDSGTVFKVLGERREDVGDFVVEANNAAQATAVRRVELAETFRRFPDFLDQLEPTMRDLGTASRLQAPALADLRAAAPTVNSLLDTLGPFARASEPAIDSLGDAGRAGRVASQEAASLVSRLSDLGTVSREPANNLDIILDHLDDRDNAVEPDSDSPTGAGYTGLEAPLQYIFDQALALNIFDQRGYALKIDLSFDECREYTTAEDVNASPEARALYERCNQNLGPNQTGITTPDRSDTTRAAGSDGDRRSESARPELPTDVPTGTGPVVPGATPAPTATTPAAPSPLQPLEDLTEQLPDVQVPDVQVPDVRAPAAPTEDLLDFLLG